jgi:hypothetical protein
MQRARAQSGKYPSHGCAMTVGGVAESVCLLKFFSTHCIGEKELHSRFFKGRIQLFSQTTATYVGQSMIMKLLLLIVSTCLLAARDVLSQSAASSFSLQVLKSCKSGQCVAGLNNVVTVAVTTGQIGTSPCAPQTPFGLCPGAPLFNIGSFLNYSLILVDAKTNAPINYTIAVPMSCNNGIISGILNTRISGYYRVQAIAFYNGNDPPQPGSIENLDCNNQPREDDPMMVYIMPG